MHENINNWKSDIKSISSQVEKEFSNFRFEQLNMKPDNDSWSIAQVLEHLIKTTESYLPVIEQAKKPTYKAPIIGSFMAGFMGNFILKSVEPGRKKKIKTFPIWEPSKSNVEGDVIKKFRSSQELLIELIDGSEEMTISGKKISSPANKNIVYKLETAFQIIVDHQKRHLNQALEIKERILSNVNVS